MSFCLPPKTFFKPLYKFCNMLIAGRAGNFGPVDTSSTYLTNSKLTFIISITYGYVHISLHVRSTCKLMLYVYIVQYTLYSTNTHLR